MGNRQGTFAKRQREADLKDKARAKRERRAARGNEVKVTKGPQIAWEDAVVATTTIDTPGTSLVPTDDSADDDDADDPPAR